MVLALLLVACAPAAAPGPGGPTAPQSSGAQAGAQAPAQAQASAAPKRLAIGLDEDVKNLWEAMNSGGGSGVREVSNMVNQHLVAISADGSPTPRLLAELPSIDNGTWRVNADGTMETTWKLRPNALWHDGTPFTADDVIFSFQVGRDPDIPTSNREALRYMSHLEAQDPNTVVVHWERTYPYADRLEHREFYPLAKHIVGSAFEGSKEAFLAHPYFNAEFVGLGPYQIAQWESGSHMDLKAFDRFFLGKPKIDNIRVQFIPDPNTMLANLNARSIQMMLTLGSIPDFEAMMTLKREWEASGYGTVLSDPISYRFLEVQQFHSPSPTDLTDPRVRQAMLTAINRPELVNAIFGDVGVVADSWLHPSFAKYAALQEAITKHPYDKNRAMALLADAGWRPGADGTLEKGGQRFTLTMRGNDSEDEVLIISANWKEIGIAANYEHRTAAALRDRQDRATYTGVDVTSQPMGLGSVVRKIASYNIPTADNRWNGTNRGGYANPAWDALEKRVLVALDDRTRLDLERDLLRLYTTDLPLLPLFFRNDLVPTGGGVTGVQANKGVAHRGFILHTWNVHEWDVSTKN
jgi:peptide/nickel transport system substrate-binding protein